MRQDTSKDVGTRASALWGRRGGERTALVAVVTAAALAIAGSASGAARDGATTTFVPSTLLQQALAQPDRTFDVIVQGDKGSHGVAKDIASEHGSTRREFTSIAGAAATLTGKQLQKLAQHKHITAITPDVRLAGSSYQDATMWRYAADVFGLTWSTTTYTQSPAIAILDSGIQDRKEFPKVLVHVNFSSLSPGATGDQQGHGTMVAGIAAGSGKYGGAAQSFPLLDVRTADSQGQSLTSDVIAACDWMIANKTKYNIRVANFSMSGRVASSFTSDPLDRAVEKLWFNGIVVVAAAGNNGTGAGPVQIAAPANDPFVITVGALDIHSTSPVGDDTVPWWSAYGHTLDGFEKPEISAPGRYLIGPVPMGSTLTASFPDRVIDPSAGFMWMSGTSFAAPVVAGAAAQLLYRHPEWTPGQVKGALMLAARAVAGGDLAAGVGEVDVAAAAALVAAPNANKNLDAFVTTDPTTGQKSFDVAGWTAAVSAAGGWSSAGWAEASWAGASWSGAAWAQAAWSMAGWAESTSAATAGWSEAGWAEANWAE